MVFDGHNAASACADVLPQRRRVNRLDAVEIDHANGDAFGCELLVGSQGLVQSHASGDDRGAVTRTLA